MSISDDTDFDDWLREVFTRSGPFTAFVVLVDIAETMVTPLCSTYFHVIGTEIDWTEMTVMLAGSGQEWSGAAFFADEAAGRGPLDNVTARVKLQALEKSIDADRLHLNTGELFDKWGRRLRVEEVTIS